MKSDDDQKPMDWRRYKKTFTLHPAILRVCRQVFEEGYEILYRENTAKATIYLWYDDDCSSHDFLGALLPLHDDGRRIAHRFIKWDVTVQLHIDIPKDVPNSIFRFISAILLAIPNLKKLKVRLMLWQSEDISNDTGRHTTFADRRNLNDIAEQIFRPFSNIRVRQAEFVDEQECPIPATLSLSRLMMSDIRPPLTLHRLFDDLNFFLENSLSEESIRVVRARLVPLEVACDQYDVDAFRYTLRSLLTYLRDFRDLVPPHSLVEFAQDSASAATGAVKISD